jgi:hypothetical protein
MLPDRFRFFILHSSFFISPHMTAIFSKLKSHFLSWREWELNPIVIKELRQAVRSWAVTGMLLLFLIVLFVTSLIFLVNQSFDMNGDIQPGGAMFLAFMVILAGASIFFIPLYVGIRVAAERQDNNPDLLYVSTLSPARIIRGKFLCGAYMALLFFSACMPFMAFTNLLRGVDLPTVFFILAYLFMVVCAANMVAIFVACIPASRPFKILFALGGLFASFWIVVSLVEISFEFMRSGVGAMMAGRDFWMGVLTAVGIGAAVAGLFFVLAVALISPPSANRALPVRIYLTIIWLLGGLLSFGWVAQTGEALLMSAWTYPTFMIMMFALLVTVSNADQLSLRVRRTIPQSRLKRALAFLFFNGAAGGLVWAAAILIATFLLTTEIMSAFPKSLYTTSNEAGEWFATTAAYAFDYALLALFIQRSFLSRRPPKLTGLLAVLLAGAWAVAPSIVLFFLNQLSWKSVEGLQLGNIFNVGSLRDDDQRLYHLYFAFGWLLVMLVVNAKWFLRQMENFHPPARTATENYPPAPE